MKNSWVLIAVYYVNVLALLLSTCPAAAAGGSVLPERLCVCPGGEATFVCSVVESGGTFTWITNTTTEACRVFSSSPQSQCGQFIGQLQTSSVSTLTATSAVTIHPGNILIECHHNVDLVGNGTLLIADPGTSPPTPILHNVTSGDIQDNGDGVTRNVSLRWTLSALDDCLNTIRFNVTPDDPTHCGSCEVGPGDPGMQEEFSCQVTQGIGQSCTYTVYAVRCGGTQNGAMSEPVEVHVPGTLDATSTLPTTSPGTLPATSPGTLPTASPGTLPTASPGTLPTTTGLGTLPTTGPGTLPTTSPGTLPTTGPGTLPATRPGTLPTTGPGTLPTTSPGTLPTTGPGPPQPPPVTSSPHLPLPSSQVPVSLDPHCRVTETELPVNNGVIFYNGSLTCHCDSGYYLKISKDTTDGKEILCVPEEDTSQECPWSWTVIGGITAGIVVIDILLLAVLTTIITIMRRPSKTVNQLRATASMASMALTQNPGYKVTQLDPTYYDYPLLRFSRPSEPQQTPIREDTVSDSTCPNSDVSQNPLYEFEHSPSTNQDHEDMAPQDPHIYDVIA